MVQEAEETHGNVAFSDWRSRQLAIELVALAKHPKYNGSLLGWR